MRTRSEAISKSKSGSSPNAAKDEDKKKVDVVIKHDVVNEQIVLAAASHDSTIRSTVCLRLQPDTFLTPEHKVYFRGLQTMEKRKLDFDVQTLATLVEIDRDYVKTILRSHPVAPKNIAHFISLLLWDKARHTTATGPLAQLVQEISDPRTDPERVRSLGQQVGQSLSGFQDRTYLRDGPELVRAQMAEIEKRSEGLSCYKFGIDALDFYEPIPGEEPKRRLVPGPAPGHVVVVTGVPGSGKTTTTAHLVNGLRKEGRRVLVGAWEVPSGTYLELLATLELGFHRTDVMLGNLDTEQKAELKSKMEEIASTVRFMDKGFFRRSGEKRSNDRHLDLVQGYISDSGCDVFVADLWKRCLVRADPEEEELALIRQQAMLEEMGVCGILIQQQRSKDIESRPDKRPTREGIKGSGAWTEVADLIIGVHRPALWKKIDDNFLEVFFLKQRYGKWPLGVEVEWNPEFGSIGKGRSIAYDQPGESESSDIDNAFAEPKGPKGRRFPTGKRR